MSQTKAQLIQPIGVVTASGVVVSGVMTAGTFEGAVVGSATSIIQGTNLNLGAFNATSFAGDFTGNATGIITSSAIKVGSLTASSFVGDFTGTATSMAKGTGFKAGTVTATPANVTYAVTVGSKTGGGNAFYLDGIEAPVPSLYPGATYTFDQSDSTNGTHPLRFATAADAAGSTGYSVGVTVNGTQGSAGAYTRIVVSPSAPDTLYYYCTAHSGMGDSINITNLLQGPVTGAVTGDVKGNIAGNITGNVTGNAVGAAGSVLSGSNIHVGVMTATSYSGDGSNLTGIAATNFNTQTVTANAAETIIDLSDGNMITMNQSANTTVGFASTSTAMDITIIRIKDSTTTARTITWPDSVKWDGGSAPTLINSPRTDASQQFQFLTRDSGLTWYAWENMQVEPTTLEIFGMGRNNYGMLGLNDRTDRSSPTQSVWVHIGAGLAPNTARQGGIKKDGTLWVWGRNGDGDLGLNDKVDRSSPVQLGTDTTWANVELKQEGMWAVKTDGTLWGWGGNQYGNLGQNVWPGGTRSSPIQVPGTTWSTDPKSMGAGGDYAVFIKTDGTLWAWGYGNNGRLGLNSSPGNKNYSSPTQVGTDTTWDTIDTGENKCFATKTNGTFWAWGSASGDGDLGLNDKTNRSSPTQLPGTNWSTGYQKLTSHSQGGAGIKTDGTLWTWGNNGNGELGLGNKTEYSSPKQVGTNTTWRSVQGGTDSLMATKTDGTLWGWGFNTRGNLGLNDRTQYSSPKQVGTATNWSEKIGAGSGQVYWGMQLPT